ncbi:hypothetical protein CPC08DRAFT_213504 [Agrocybe pediades]|nr:hypothetical protein CPC08DRAFT_213504 [Agrocybe pediades]
MASVKATHNVDSIFIFLISFVAFFFVSFFLVNLRTCRNYSCRCYQALILGRAGSFVNVDVRW